MQRSIGWWITLAFALACAGASSVAACASNTAPDSSDTGPTGVDGGTGSDAATPDSAPTSDASDDASTNGDACGAVEGGVGAVCTDDKQCRCGTVCAALRCVPRAACDEALLAWDGTATLADGTCASAIGYNVYWEGDAGPDADAGERRSADAGSPCRPSATMIACGDAGQSAPVPSCAYRVPHLTNATWTFTVTAYDITGAESAPSVAASKTVNCP